MSARAASTAAVVRTLPFGLGWGQSVGIGTPSICRTRAGAIHPELRRILDSLDRHPDGRVFHGPTNKVVKPDVVRNVLIREVLSPLKANSPVSRDILPS